MSSLLLLDPSWVALAINICTYLRTANNPLCDLIKFLIELL